MALCFVLDSYCMTLRLYYYNNTLLYYYMITLLYYCITMLVYQYITILVFWHYIATIFCLFVYIVLAFPGDFAQAALVAAVSCGQLCRQASVSLARRKLVRRFGPYGT